MSRNVVCQRNTNDSSYGDWYKDYKPWREFGEEPNKIWPIWPKKPINSRPINNYIICPYCGQDSGIPSVLYMVIPQCGLACHCCGEILFYPNDYWC